MVEGEIGCDVMGETQSGSTVSMELTHVRKTFVGTWEGSARPVVPARTPGPHRGGRQP